MVSRRESAYDDEESDAPYEMVGPWMSGRAGDWSGVGWPRNCGGEVRSVRVLEYYSYSVLCALEMWGCRGPVFAPPSVLTRLSRALTLIHTHTQVVSIDIQHFLHLKGDAF